jgi:hypothetical protein
MPGVKANTQKKGGVEEKKGGGGKAGMAERLAGGDKVRFWKFTRLLRLNDKASTPRPAGFQGRQ